MKPLDLSSVYRGAIGFDQLFTLLQQNQQVHASYPPFNVEALGDNRYRITMAVAGFGREDVEVVREGETLTVTGRQPKDDGIRKFVHRGIATRDFRQRFALAEHVNVASACFDNGLLHIDLVREVPEAQRPKRIDIVDGAPANSPPALLSA